MNRPAWIAFGVLAVKAVCAEQLVLPESPTKVVLSNTDINRVACESPISDIFYSSEKWLTHEIVGRNAFLKFRFMETDPGRVERARQPTEAFIVCGGIVYTVIAEPKKLPAQTLRLVGEPKSAKRNMEIFEGLAWEEQILRLTQYVFHAGAQSLPDSFHIEQPERGSIELFEELVIRPIRIVRIEGTGLRLTEFRLTSSKDGLELNNAAFLDTRIGADIVGVAVHPPKLDRGQHGRLLVTEWLRQAAGSSR